eukprot:100234-Rhodomonas_salina.2
MSAYAMSGTDIVHGAVCLRDVRYSHGVGCYVLRDIRTQVHSAINLRAYYYNPGTDVAYATTWRSCTVLPAYATRGTDTRMVLRLGLVLTLVWYSLDEY